MNGSVKSLLGATLLIGLIGVSAILYARGWWKPKPVFGSRPPSPIQNLKHVATSLHIYIAANDDTYPNASDWMTRIRPILKNDAFLAPFEDPTGPPAVAMMKRLGGQKRDSVEHLERQALAFETTDRRANVAYNFVNVWWRDERPTAIAFANSHAKAYKRDDPRTPRPGSGLSPLIRTSSP